jgi:integrase
MYHGAAVLPAAANGLVKMLRLLMRLAIALQWRTDDPTSGVALYATRAGGHHTWVEHEIARYLEVHGPGTLARRAMLLMLYTGAARADAVKLGWQNVRDGRLTYRRQKTGKAKVDLLVDITIHPDLAAELADCPPGALTFLQTQQGRSRSPNGLGMLMSKWCAAAGLPECTAHGLRKAIARRLAEKGASAREIAAVTGHRTLAEVQRYADKANRATMGTPAIALLAGTPREQKVSNHPEGLTTLPI